MRLRNAPVPKKLTENSASELNNNRVDEDKTIEFQRRKDGASLSRSRRRNILIAIVRLIKRV